jgi:acetylornithine/succinyldiaminopimelate/putrescine aminotransferase
MAMRICLINAKHHQNKNVFLVSNKAFHGKSLGPQALGTSG